MEHDGRLTVDEFLKLARGIVDLVNGTSLSQADQAKIDQAFEKLNANDSAVAAALAETQEGGK